MPFFNFNNFLKKHKIDFWNQSTLLALIGERNVGKTTSPLTEMMKKASSDNKILIARLTNIQLKTQVADFNNRFSNQYISQAGMIYKLVPYTKFNKLTQDDETLYKRGECIGYMADVSNYHNYKSVEAKDVKMIFIDEVIQLDIIPLFYEKLMNLLMTFARFNKPSILLVGNRDTPNNELMVLWEIEPTEIAPKEDRVINFDKNCYYVELGSDQFKDLYSDDDPHIVKTLSKHHSQTDLYMNYGGYLIKNAMNVLPFKKRIKETFDAKYMITFGKRVAVVGTFENDKLVVCINQEAIDIAESEKLITIPLDSEGAINRQSITTTIETSEKITKQLLIQYKKGNLYCDSFELLNYLEQRMKFVAYVESFF